MTPRPARRAAPPGPLAASGLWAAVMGRAGYQCQCAGECGRSHRRHPAGRCPAEHSEHCQLHAAPPPGPAEPAGYAAAARLGAEQLRAYCPGCHAGLARRRGGAQPPATPDALF